MSIMDTKAFMQPTDLHRIFVHKKTETTVAFSCGSRAQ